MPGQKKAEVAPSTSQEGAAKAAEAKPAAKAEAKAEAQRSGGWVIKDGRWVPEKES